MMKSENDLLEEALEAQKNAICPYSDYPVGAALITDNNHIIRGFNIESKAYPTTLCAERVAIFSALSQGYSKFSAMAIVTNDKGSPCGGCRQIMYEYLGNVPIIIANKEKDILRTTVLELLPNPFG